MKKITIAVIFMTSIAFGTIVNAQPGRPAELGPGRGPLPGPAEPRPLDGLRPVASYQGKVVKLGSNDDFVFDGLYILNGTDSLLVKFPAHLGKQIMSAAKVGTAVSVSGTLETPAFGMQEVRMVSITVNGKTLTDTPPTEPAGAPVEKFTEGKGKIIRTQTDREGRTGGFVLENKILLKLPPHVSAQLGNALQAGSTVAYTGNQKSVESGEVSLADYAIVHCNTLTINGQQYLIR